MNNEISRMQNAIKKYLQSKTKTTKKNTGAVQGKFDGKKILVGNKTYDYDLAVDMAIQKGDTVWCVLSDNGTTAVVVGM